MTKAISINLFGDINTNVIDSMPIPVCRYARAKKIKILNDQQHLKPNRGYNHFDKSHYFGFICHLLISGKILERLNLENQHRSLERSTEVDLFSVPTVPVKPKSFNLLRLKAVAVRVKLEMAGV